MNDAPNVKLITNPSRTRVVSYEFKSNDLVKVKEAEPEIFVQSHSLIFPPGSLDAEPCNAMLSVGKVTTWSGR